MITYKNFNYFLYSYTICKHLEGLRSSLHLFVQPHKKIT
jgi:hypothetical protein